MNIISDEALNFWQMYNCTTHLLHYDATPVGFFLSCTTFFVTLPFPLPNANTSVGFDPYFESLGRCFCGRGVRQWRFRTVNRNLIDSSSIQAPQAAADSSTGLATNAKLQNSANLGLVGILPSHWAPRSLCERVNHKVWRIDSSQFFFKRHVATKRNEHRVHTLSDTKHDINYFPCTWRRSLFKHHLHR